MEFTNRNAQCWNEAFYRRGLLAVIGAALFLLAPTTQAVTIGLDYQISPLYTTVDSPANHVVGAGGTLDGVGDLIITRTTGSVRCTATLLPTGRHILTAAHCITDSNGVNITNSANITFAGGGGNTTIGVSNIVTHPDWDGDFFRGNDVAVLELNTVAPVDIDRYDIYRGNGEVGNVADKVGYGQSGTGNTGSNIGSGTKRSGQNLYDALADTMLDALGLIAGVDYVPGSVLQYDFDNGLAANDGFGFFFGLNDLGLGNDEVLGAPGDSGGPSFFNGLIAGITSYGIRLTSGGGTMTSDIDGTLNDSYGEFEGDTRVSSYAAFIDGQLFAVPLPATLPLLLSGLVGFGVIGRRRGRSAS